jgi:hypothetical protein
MGLTLKIKHYRTDDAVQVERLAALREVFELDREGPDEGSD